MMNQETSIAFKITKQSVWQKAEALGLPAAMWRLPNGTNIHLIVGQQPELLHNTFETFRNTSGFSIAQFINEDKTFFIPSDYHIIFDGNNQPIQQLGQTLNISKSIESLFQKEPNIQQIYPKLEPIKQQYEALIFENMVKQAIDAIKGGQMQKVVLSRTKQVELTNKFELIEAFNELCTLYPTAFISMVSLPHLGQIWMGASPETLVSQDANGIFRTMALAGTQSAFDSHGRKIETHDAMWRQKEIEEQAYVSRYIIDCFKKDSPS